MIRTAEGSSTLDTVIAQLLVKQNCLLDLASKLRSFDTTEVLTRLHDQVDPYLLLVPNLSLLLNTQSNECHMRLVGSVKQSGIGKTIESGEDTLFVPKERGFDMIDVSMSIALELCGIALFSVDPFECLDSFPFQRSVGALHPSKTLPLPRISLNNSEDVKEMTGIGRVLRAVVSLENFPEAKEWLEMEEDGFLRRQLSQCSQRQLEDLAQSCRRLTIFVISQLGQEKEKKREFGRQLIAQSVANHLNISEECLLYLRPYAIKQTAMLTRVVCDLYTECSFL